MHTLTKLIAVFVLLFNLAALSIQGADIDDLTWEINDDDTVSIIDCNQDATGDLVIPDVIERRVVTSIGESAGVSVDSRTWVSAYLVKFWPDIVLARRWWRQ